MLSTELYYSFCQNFLFPALYMCMSLSKILNLNNEFSPSISRRKELQKALILASLEMSKVIVITFRFKKSTADFQLLPEYFQWNNTSVTTGRRKHHQKLDAIIALIPTDTKTENTLYLHLTETYPFTRTQHDLL